MKRFKFRLAKLEKLRKRTKRDTRIALAEAIAEAYDRTRQREAFESRLADSNRQALPATQVSDPKILRQLAAWRDGLHTIAVHAAGLEREANAFASEKTKEYSAASRAHRVLELLKEKRYRRWLEDSEIEERKFLDEIHLLRLARAGSGKED